MSTFLADGWHFDARPVHTCDESEYFMCTTTTVAAEEIGYRSMTRAPRLSNDLDALLRRVARRDSEAFAAFYDRTSSRVYGLVTRVLRDAGYSEETTQESTWRCGGLRKATTPRGARRCRGC